MKLASFKHLLIAISLLSLLMGATACQKKCGKPITEPFRNLSATKWRFVESTNPGFKSLSKYTFLIMEFTADFSGQVFSVVDNRVNETPDRLFRWKADPDSDTLYIAYTSTTGEPLEGEEPAGGEEGAPSVITYNYDLKRELNLQEAGNGYTYRLVAYDDEIIEPDDTCTY